MLLGPGDDAAVLGAPDGRVVATTDLLVDGRHFNRDWSTGYDVGRRAAAANLADVAAMGAAPTALLVGLAAPGELPLAWAEALADGLADEAESGNCSVVGGDVVASDRLTVAVTALGDLEGREPVTRSGARPGDRLLLAGRAGWAAAGLALLEAGVEGEFADLVAAHRFPVVDYPAARWLAQHGATAMLDVSDGLAGDAGHLAGASGVALEIDTDALPVDPMLEAAGRRLGVPPLSWVAGGGDDHAFLATLPPDRELPAGVATIGRVVEGSGVRWSGETPPASPHEHFRGPR